MTLPDGRKVLGKINHCRRTDRGVEAVSGIVHHPEAGSFSFERGQALTGTLLFDSKTTVWKITAAPGGEGYHLIEVPAEDSFRPRQMKMPTPTDAQRQPGMSREEAEAILRKDLKIEEAGPDKLRIGEVEIAKQDRSIRLPATFNMHDGTVEYALVTTTGKCHESLFSTTASPRDVHLAMLLLGVKPAKCVEGPDKRLQVPEGSAVEVRAEWQVGDQKHSHAIKELLTIARSASGMRKALAAENTWLYNGSRFNAAGFAASVEGSIVSLIADDFALINNAGDDRGDDEVHVPNSAMIPARGTPATIIIRLPRPLESGENPASELPNP